MQPPQPDEGTAAHIFQFSILAFVLVLFFFLLTAEWKQPRQSAQALAVPAVILMIALGALYYLKHYR